MLNSNDPNVEYVRRKNIISNRSKVLHMSDQHGDEQTFVAL